MRSLLRFYAAVHSSSPPSVSDSPMLAYSYRPGAYKTQMPLCLSRHPSRRTSYHNARSHAFSASPPHHLFSKGNQGCFAFSEVFSEAQERD